MMTKYLGAIATLAFLALDVVLSVLFCVEKIPACLIATVPLAGILGIMIAFNDWPNVWKPLLAGKP